MKAMDYWTTGCYFTVFTALVEYCIVLYLVQKAEWERKITRHIKTQVRKRKEKKGWVADAYDDQRGPGKIFDEKEEQIRKKEIAATKVELAARILLPAFFVLFNMIFWIAVFA